MSATPSELPAVFVLSSPKLVLAKLLIVSPF